MREIKFRAWDGRKMNLDVSIVRGDAIKKGYHGAAFTSAARAGTVMQYTGLKDKNGVEIYNGDIVCAKLSDGTIDQTAVVVQESACEWSWGEYGTIHLALIYHKDTEVIGNIHQNPELLE